MILARSLLHSFVLHPWTRGGLLASGSPVTVLANGSFNSNPGVTKLDDTRVLCVFEDVNGINGIIGTDTGGWVFTWGSPFLIRSIASVYLYDGVNVIDDKVVITFTTGSGGLVPYVLICNDPPASFSSSSTWGSPIVIVSGPGNLTNGPVQKLIDGTYLITAQTAVPDPGDGVILSSSLTDWSAATTVTVGANDGTTNFSEIVVRELADGTLKAHLRTGGEGAVNPTPILCYVSTSMDHGATWTTPTSLFAGYGYPQWRPLASGLQLAVYRQVTSWPYSLGMPYWRQSTDDGATWSAETLLDATLIGGQPSYEAYNTILQLDNLHALALYAIADQRGGAYPSNLYSQVFTDSSHR